MFSRVIESNQVQTVTVASDPSLGRSGLEYNPSNHVPNQSKDYQPIKSVGSSDQVNILTSDQLVNGQIEKPTSHRQVNPIKGFRDQVANYALIIKSDNRHVNSETLTRFFDKKSDRDISFLGTISSVKYNMKNPIIASDFKISNASYNFEDRDLKRFTYRDEKNSQVEVSYDNNKKLHSKSYMTHREESIPELDTKDKKYRDNRKKKKKENYELEKKGRGKSEVTETTSDGINKKSRTSMQEDELKNSQEDGASLYARTHQGRNTFNLYIKKNE